MVVLGTAYTCIQIDAEFMMVNLRFTKPVMSC